MWTHPGRVSVCCAVLLLAIVVLASCGTRMIDESSPAQHVLNSVYNSVVNVTVNVTGTLTGQAIGSGVVYTEDGYILTNAHVVTLEGLVTSGQKIDVTFSSGETVSGKLVGMNETRDVAAIKVEKAGLTPVRFATPGDVALGEWATVIGSPLDFRNTVSLGIISGLDRSLSRGSGKSPLTGLIQVDAAISQGSSGGGCFDQSGDFVGMPEGYFSPMATGAENIAFAIPAEVVASVAKTLIGR